jgi:zinc transport system substrate-binding protein
VCIFSEPQFSPRLIATVVEGTDVRTATLDPLGAALEQGRDLYPRLLLNLAQDLVGCLTE